MVDFFKIICSILVHLYHCISILCLIVTKMFQSKITKKLNNLYKSVNKRSPCYWKVYVNSYYKFD